MRKQLIGKVVMTLLVPRKIRKKYPYAVQLGWPEIDPLTGAEIEKVSVRLIDNNGERAERWVTSKYHNGGCEKG